MSEIKHYTIVTTRGLEKIQAAYHINQTVNLTPWALAALMSMLPQPLQQSLFLTNGQKYLLSVTLKMALLVAVPPLKVLAVSRSMDFK